MKMDVSLQNYATTMSVN